MVIIILPILQYEPYSLLTFSSSIYNQSDLIISVISVRLQEDDIHLKFQETPRYMNPRMNILKNQAELI